MLNELESLYERLNACRKDLYSFYQRLDTDKNKESRDAVLAAQLNVMEATAKIGKILERAKKKKEGE